MDSRHRAFPQRSDTPSDPVTLGSELVVARDLTKIFVQHPEMAQQIADVYFLSGRLGSYDFWVQIADGARLLKRT